MSGILLSEIPGLSALRWLKENPRKSLLGAAALGTMGTAAYNADVDQRALGTAPRTLSAYHEGSSPMSTPMTGWNEYMTPSAQLKKEAMTNQEKTAMYRDALFGKTAGRLGETISKAVGGVSTPLTHLGRATAQQFASDSPEALQAARDYLLPALGVGVAGVGAGMVLDPLEEYLSPALGVAGSDFSRQHQSIYQRADMDTVAARAFAETMGEEAAKGLSGLMGGALDQGKQVVQQRRNMDNVHSMITNDPILSKATPEEKQLLQGAYQTASQVGPNAMAHPYAARNFLREVMVTGNGPDVATLKNLADTERALNNRYT